MHQNPLAAIDAERVGQHDGDRRFADATLAISHCQKELPYNLYPLISRQRRSLQMALAAGIV